jgi:hypothetical protein
MKEPRYPYSVTVEMPNSPSKTIGVSAVSTWHAIDIVYTTLGLYKSQEDRSKYNAKKLGRR